MPLDTTPIFTPERVYPYATTVSGRYFTIRSPLMLRIQNMPHSISTEDANLIDGIVVANTMHLPSSSSEDDEYEDDDRILALAKAIMQYFANSHLGNREWLAEHFEWSDEVKQVLFASNFTPVNWCPTPSVSVPTAQAVGTSQPPSPW